MTDGIYPTFDRISATEYRSAEKRDGVPDFTIMRDATTQRWHVKWRTSANWSSETFATPTAAMASIREVLGIVVLPPA